MKKLIQFASLWLLTAAVGYAQFVGGPLQGCSGSPVTGSAWNSATALNATQALVNNTAVPVVVVQLQQTTTITAGKSQIEGTYDGTNWIVLPPSQILDPNNNYVPMANPYTLVASTNQTFAVLMQGMSSLRLKMQTQLTGTGAITPITTTGCYLQSVRGLGVPFETDALTAVQSVKATAGAIYGYNATNTNASVCYLQIFNTASGSVTLGTTAPIITIGLPATSSAHIMWPYPIQFGTAISIAATTASKGASTCGTGMAVNIFYQ